MFNKSTHSMKTIKVSIGAPIKLRLSVREKPSLEASPAIYTFICTLSEKHEKWNRTLARSQPDT